METSTSRRPHRDGGVSSRCRDGDSNGDNSSDKVVSSAADVFSLGCLGYMLLSGGAHPFGSDAAARERRVLQGNSALDIRALQHVPEKREVCDLISVMLDQTVAGRPPEATPGSGRDARALRGGPSGGLPGTLILGVWTIWTISVSSPANSTTVAADLIYTTFRVWVVP